VAGTEAVRRRERKRKSGRMVVAGVIEWMSGTVNSCRDAEKRTESFTREDLVSSLRQFGSGGRRKRALVDGTD
jgi:hypothetical protein